MCTGARTKYTCGHICIAWCTGIAGQPGCKTTFFEWSDNSYSMCDRCNGYGTKKPENELRDDTRLAIDYVDMGIPVPWPPASRPWVPLPEDKAVYEALIAQRVEQQARIQNYYAQAAYAQPQFYPTQHPEFLESQIQTPYAEAAYAQPHFYPTQNLEFLESQIQTPFPQAEHAQPQFHPTQQPVIIDPQMLGEPQQWQGQQYPVHEKQLDPMYYQPQPDPTQYQPAQHLVCYEPHHGQGQPQPGSRGTRPPYRSYVSIAPAPNPIYQLSHDEHDTGTNDPS